jgi:hypothetical protein
MKKMSLLTQNFINDNIKNNAAISSYPQRIVAPKQIHEIQKKVNSIELVKETAPKLSSFYPFFNTKD